jgi:hypothetical protein
MTLGRVLADDGIVGKSLRNLYILRVPPTLLYGFKAYRASHDDLNDDDKNALRNRLTTGLESLADKCKANGAVLGVVILRDPLAVFDAGDVASLLSDSTIPILDLSRYLSYKEHHIPKEGHFSALGHERVAKLVARWLGKEKPFSFKGDTLDVAMMPKME